MTKQIAIAALELARELVLEGWTQGAYVRSGSGWAVPLHARTVRRVCAAGAVDRAGLALGIPFHERELLRAYLVGELHGGRDGDDLALERWNDEPGRTRDDVVSLYDVALARLAS